MFVVYLVAYLILYLSYLNDLNYLRNMLRITVLHFLLSEVFSAQDFDVYYS